MIEKYKIATDAILLRKEMGEDSFSPIDIFSMVSEQNDITLTFFPMSERLSGICIKNDKNKVVAINSNMSYGRQRFTLAHELCHLYYHGDFGSIVCQKDIEASRKDEKEKEADIFASFFLLPQEALQQYLKNNVNSKTELEVDDVVRLEQYFGISRQAILYRLVSDRFLDKVKSENMKTNIILSARRLGFDDKLYRPTEEKKAYYTLGEYISKAETIKEKHLISEGKYEELLLDAFRSDIVFGDDIDGEEQYD
jgi:Zn-dependent peptidase ImmA (M78 family)